MIKILHLAKDEKFIDLGIKNFNSINYVQNEYYIVSSYNKLKYVNNNEVKIIDTNYYLNYLSRFCFYSNFDLIVFHSIEKIDRKFIKKIKPDIKILWIGWGYDYINLLDYSKNSFYSVKTKFILKERKKFFKSSMLSFFKKTKLVSYLQSLIFKNECERINYFSPVIKEDYLLIKSKWKSFKPKYIPWNYGININFLSIVRNNRFNGTNILIGNSASPFNNHIDIFNSLKNLNFDCKLICPLSYGESWYKQKILNLGFELFPLNFAPISDFMSFDSYLKILKSCSIGVFNHYRQQGAGNILILLGLGVKVYLSPNNPLFHNLVNYGFFVFSIEELDVNMLSPLSDNQIKINKNLIFQKFNDFSYVNRTDNLLKSIFTL